MKEFSATMSKFSLAHFLIPMGFIVACTPQCSSAIALLMGIIIALIFGNPYGVLSKKISSLLLGIAIVGLGASMNLNTIKSISSIGLFYIIISVIFTFLCGIVISRYLKVDKETSLLICMGTAICGGSAIAALAPVIKAKDDAISLALIEVFLLNAIALIMFPYVGHFMGLSQSDFGLWSALAIHDTSSVVGATVSYGQEALMVGTTVKLVRALWIIPIVVFFSAINSGGEDKNIFAKVKIPWFIVGFMVMTTLVSVFPSIATIGQELQAYAKQAFVIVLFLIGTGMKKESIKTIGFRSFSLAIALWLLVSSLSLVLICLSS